MEEEDDGAAEEGGAGGGVDSTLTQLIEVKRKIIEVNRQLCKLKKLALISKMASSSEPTSLRAAQQRSSSEASGAPISEGASSSPNGVLGMGEVNSQGGSNVMVPPPDAAKNVVNGIDSECPNSAVKSDDPLESPLCPNASLLPDSGIMDVESIDVNIHENTGEVDPLLGGFSGAAAEGEQPGYKAKEEEEEEEEDSVFIDEGDDEQPTTPAVATAAARCTTCVMTEWKDGIGEKKREEAPIVIPPSSSKSYSSVASSPPTTNSSLNPSSPPTNSSSIHGPPPTHQRPQQQQPQSLYPPRYFRASSLPPHSSSIDKSPPTSSTQSPTTSGQEQRYHHRRPPSPAVYSTRPQGSEFIPIPGSNGAASCPLPIEQEWPTLRDSQQQPRRIRTHNTGSSTPDVASKPPPTSVLGSPPMSGPTAVLGSPPLPSMRRSSSGSAPNFSNPLLPAPTTAQSILPPRLAKMRQGAAVVTSQSIVHTQGTAPKRRPAGIGRGGRPLPPLDSSMLGGGVGGIGRGVPPVRPIIVPSGGCGGRPPIPPHLYMDPPVNAPPGMRGRPLLPSPLRPSVVIPPPVTTPIPISPEERWIYMSRRGRPRSKYDYPPLGSSAGLDII